VTSICSFQPVLVLVQLPDPAGHTTVQNQTEEDLHAPLGSRLGSRMSIQAANPNVRMHCLTRKAKTAAE
jgi:hypothetical protein